jgi:peptidyl-prolyl cis-trans isomerase B (cyclophilin B)
MRESGGMKRTLPVVVVLSMLAAVALPAQGEGKSGKADGKTGGKETAKVEAPKDDPMTAKDPVVEAIDAFLQKNKVDQKKPGWRLSMARPPQPKFPAGRDWFWHMQTNQGTVVIRLLPDVAPNHVSSAIYLVRSGYYDGLGFHRVITRFMAQGGCPQGNGSGGPGYEMDGEFNDTCKHDRPGLLSMANRGPGTDGSQFFLTFVPTPHLDGKHTIYGEVVEGMETVAKLEAGGSQSGRVSAPLVMERNWIRVAERAAAPAAGDGDGKVKEPAKGTDAGK